MRSFLACCVLVFAAHACAQAVETTVCEILAHPAAYDGKLVRVTGTVVAALDEFAIKDRPCGHAVDAIWLSYPEGTKAKSGPVAMLSVQLAVNDPSAAARPEIKLDKNKDFKRFDEALSDQAKDKGDCLGCPRYSVRATFAGRIDAVDTPVLARHGRTFDVVRGFGNMNRYPARLVLQSVSKVSESEIDYSRPATATASGIPLGLNADQVTRAAAAFGAEGENNGVIVSFGTANTIPTQDQRKRNESSPDGLIFRLTLDTDRLKGPGLGEAMAHMGTHIADLRETPGGRTLLELEAHAWAAAILAAVQAREKTLTLAGSYQLWNSNWSDQDREKLLRPAVGSFLTEWSALSPAPER